MWLRECLWGVHLQAVRQSFLSIRFPFVPFWQKKYFFSEVFVVYKGSEHRPCSIRKSISKEKES